MKRKLFLVQLIIFVGILSACSNQNSKTEIPSTTDITISKSKNEDSARYIWQNWANTLQMEDIDHIDLICDDKQFPYATYCGEELQPVVELIHSIDGTQRYVVIAEDIKGTEDEQVIPMNLSYSWDVNWQDANMLLEPGDYRIGMTLHETLHAQKQNETICYVKFSVE